MTIAAGAYAHPLGDGGQHDAAKAAGKGLLVSVRMGQDPFGKQIACGRGHGLPGIGIVVPTVVGMAHADFEVLFMDGIPGDSDEHDPGVIEISFEGRQWLERFFQL